MNFYRLIQYITRMFLTSFRLANLFLLGNGLYKSLTTKLPPHLIKSGQFQFITNCSLLLTVVNLLWALLGHNSIWLYNLTSNLEFDVIVLLDNGTFVSANGGWGWCWPQPVYGLKVHALPFIYLSIDYQLKMSFIASTILTFGFVFVYWLYIEWECGKHITDGVSGYPYPFLKGKSQWQRFLCISVFGITACCNWFILCIRSTTL